MTSLDSRIAFTREEASVVPWEIFPVAADYSFAQTIARTVLPEEESGKSFARSPGGATQ
jgi:hypothetical protein